jgi:RNA polymerase sigma factor (sigma-70 family)
MPNNNIEEKMLELEPIIYYQLHRLGLFKRFYSYRDDFLQEGRMAIWKALQSYDPDKGAKLTTYVNIVVRNFLLNYVRSMKLYQNERNIPFDEEQYLVDFDPIENMAELINDYATDNHKSILTDYFIEGLTQQEVATKNGVSQQWVSNIISRFRERLKQEWL